MPGQLLMLGPFTGGLNTASQTGEVAEEQLTELTNLNVDPDGSLTSRGPIEKINGSYEDIPGKQRRIYGSYQRDDSSWYLLIAVPTTSGYTLFAVLNGGLGESAQTTVTTVNDTSLPTDYVQYDDWAYFSVPVGSAIPAFKWSPVSGKVDVSDMPKGQSLTSLKSRLFLTGTRSASTGSRMYYSDITEASVLPDKWPSGNYLDIGFGSGGLTTAVMEINNSLYIFKDSATYRFTYSSDIKQGSVDIVSGTIGAPSESCLARYENAVYVYFSGTIYELFNGYFSNISRDMHFEDDNDSMMLSATEASLSVAGDMLIARVKNSLYAYSFLTKKWSKWVTQFGLPDRFYRAQGDSYVDGDTYIAASMSGTISASKNQYLASQSAEYLSTEKVSVSVGEEFGGVEGELQLSFTGGEGEYSEEFHFNNGAGKEGSPLSVPFTATPYSTVSLKLRTEGEGFFASESSLSYSCSGVFVFLTGQGAVTEVEAVHSRSILSDSVMDCTLTVDVPPNAIAYYPKLVLSLNSDSDILSPFVVKSIQVLRNQSKIGSGALRYRPRYAEGSSFLEKIDTRMTTSVFDFGNPSIYKRLFWWGADVRNYLDLEGDVLPVGYSQRTRWGDIDGRRWNVLSYGTWGNPLAGVNISVTYGIHDLTTAPSFVSENNRYFIKFPKSLRFRQTKFSLRASAFGTSQYGPIQMFRIATSASQKALLTKKVTP